MCTRIHTHMHTTHRVHVYTRACAHAHTQSIISPTFSSDLHGCEYLLDMWEPHFPDGKMMLPKANDSCPRSHKEERGHSPNVQLPTLGPCVYKALVPGEGTARYSENSDSEVTGWVRQLPPQIAHVPSASADVTGDGRSLVFSSSQRKEHRCVLTQAQQAQALSLLRAPPTPHISPGH